MVDMMKGRYGVSSSVDRAGITKIGVVIGGFCASLVCFGWFLLELAVVVMWRADRMNWVNVRTCGGRLREEIGMFGE